MNLNRVKDPPPRPQPGKRQETRPSKLADQGSIRDCDSLLLIIRSSAIRISTSSSLESHAFVLRICTAVIAGFAVLDQRSDRGYVVTSREEHNPQRQVDNALPMNPAKPTSSDFPFAVPFRRYTTRICARLFTWSWISTGPWPGSRGA